MFDSEDEKKDQLEKISKLWKKTLEKKGLTEEAYNKLCIEKFESKKSKSILKQAASKKELDLLIKARAIVDESVKNVSEKDSNFELDIDFKASKYFDIRNNRWKLDKLVPSVLEANNLCKEIFDKKL